MNLKVNFSKIDFKKLLNDKKNLTILIAVVAVVVIGIVIGIICATGGSDDVNKGSEPVASQEVGSDGSNGDAVVSENSEKAENSEKTEKTENAEKAENNEAVSEKAADANDKAETKEEKKADTSAPENTKYGDAEVYETKEGVPAAKTESGTEVELTGENLQKIFAEYEKEKGSGSDKEKELLDQLQLILETQGAVE